MSLTRKLIPLFAALMFAVTAALTAAPMGPALASSTLTVTTTGDWSPCGPNSTAPGYTLRCAIQQANADGSGDTIVFNIPPSGNGGPPCSAAPVVCTIIAGSAEPALFASKTLIDGFTQPSATANTHPLSAGDNARLTIRLDGASAGSGVDGLQIAGSTDTIRGLSITNFSHDGIYLMGNPTGAPTSGDDVDGDFLGVLPDGMTAAPNGVAGVEISQIASANIIGGANPPLANLISGNTQYGVYIARSANNKVYGNLIGTDRLGAKPLGNHLFGVFIQGSENMPSMNNAIGGPGGPSAGMGNVVSANGSNSVAGAQCVGGGIELITASGNTIKGNLVGTNATASAPLGNGCFDIGLISWSNSNQIGSSEPQAGNVVAGDAFDGIDVSQSHNNTIQANFIGLNTSRQPIPNGRYGAYLFNGSNGDSLGTTGGFGNVVAYNRSSGILIGSSSTDSSHVAINQNSIFANGSLGIDLAPQGAVNCSGPAAGAPNDYTPCPVIYSATPTKVWGTACAGCLVEVFVATNEADDSGHGEGMLYVGSATANAASTWTLSLAPGHLFPGQYVTATATMTSGSGVPETSEFSRNMIIPVPIVKGWNLIDLPLNNPAYAMASGLNADLNASLGAGATASIETYSSGAYHTYIQGWTPDMPLQPYQGIFVNSNVAGNWYPSGVAFYTGQTVPLAVGWNLVGVPFPATGLQTTAIASSSEAGACNVQEIELYSGGAYTTWTAPNPAILVPPTSGMWIRCTAATNWTPS